MKAHTPVKGVWACMHKFGNHNFKWQAFALKFLNIQWQVMHLWPNHKKKRKRCINLTLVKFNEDDSEGETNGGRGVVAEVYIGHLHVFFTKKIIACILKY